MFNEIERDSYSFMKPRFKDEISKLKEKLSDLEIEINKLHAISKLRNYAVAKTSDIIRINKNSLVQFFLKNLIIENDPDSVGIELPVRTK